MAFPLFFVFLVSIVFTEGDPCENYTKFPNEERRDTNYPLRTQQSRFSDRYLDETWYGSKLNITSVMPPRFVCGTYFPIWAKEVSDITNDDGTVNVTMCIHGLENCSSPFVVKAKYCDSHVVYFLTRTPLDSAYCLGAQTNVPTYTKTPVIEADLNKLSNVSCNYEKHDDDVYYSVYWYINDTYCYASSSHQWLDREKNNKLTEEAVMDKCISTTSFNITCGVRISNEDLPGGSVPVFGQPVFFDIKENVSDYCIPNGECNEIGSKCPANTCLVCSATEMNKTWQIDPTCGAAVVFIQWCMMMMSVLITSVL